MAEHNHIQMAEASSSQIHSYGYDPASKTLAVQFKHGGRYHYKDVPQEVYDSMSKAESVGSFLHQNVKGKFDYSKVGG